jgi:predicted RNA-binding Zn ribbon-like protein
MGDVHRFLHVGGHVVIDFINTLGGRPDDPDDEYLHTYGDLVVWVERAGLLSTPSAVRLHATAERAPEAARQVLDQALELRRGLDVMLRPATSRDEVGSDRSARTIHAAYLAAIAPAVLDVTADGLRWTWPDDPADLQRPVWPVATAAVDLLQAGPLHLLGQCQHCRWLFLDTSRQHNRRWCSMDACGAIVKMRRYRASRSRAVARGASDPPR